MTYTLTANLLIGGEVVPQHVEYVRHYNAYIPGSSSKPDLLSAEQLGVAIKQITESKRYSLIDFKVTPCTS